MPTKSVDPNYTIVSARIPVDLKQRLAELAKSNHRNLSQEIFRFIDLGVAAESATQG